ncbi:MAG: hypothetical protein KGI00_02680 [Candidatus Micrarchaeota archaeon]|nr:hypothetical protein [Candidatus Micrarchaeota archaeon]MDE1849612.1 hypothetical protein [Candidatus Micrarchaeota archaeon]
MNGKLDSPDNFPRIGITTLVLKAGSVQFTAAELAEGVNVSTGEQLQSEGKLRKGLMIEGNRYPSFSETNATLTADVLYKFLKKTLDDPGERAKLMDEPITHIYFATESNVDRSRPELTPALLMVYSKLLAEDEGRNRTIVEMLKRATPIQITFACAGEGIALEQAVSTIFANHAIGMPNSALVLSVDTAIYDHNKAPNAEVTQGSAATLAWITKNPKLVEVMYGKGSGAFHIPASDFNKFGSETPTVHGKFSERMYVYVVAKAYEDAERAYEKLTGRKPNPESVVTHVPFPKQAIYSATPLFAHWLRETNPALLKEIEGRPGVGPEPRLGYSRFTDMFDATVAAFNKKGSRMLEEADFIDYIEKNPQLTAYWNWYKAVRENATDEFNAFCKKLNIDGGLVLPGKYGNGYASAKVVMRASGLQEYAKKLSAGMLNDMLGADGSAVIEGNESSYGSGAFSKVLWTEAHIDSATIGNNVIVLGNPVNLPASMYVPVHENLLLGEAERTMGKGNLLEKDREFLGPALKAAGRDGRLPEGFKVIKRNDDGTGEYAHVGSRGGITKLKVRY